MKRKGSENNTNKEIKLHFKKCSNPTNAYQFEKELKRIGIKSTFFFVDDLNCFKLTGKIICQDQETFEEMKKAIAILRIEKPKVGE